MSLIEQIDNIVSQKSLLNHPFYQKWNEGTLSFDALRGYSKEYFLLVESIPNLVSKVSSFSNGAYYRQISENLKEEEEHIPLWMNFANRLGITNEELKEYRGLPKTRRAMENFSNLISSLNSGATAMYAFEKEIPTISQTKIDGLIKFYKFEHDNSIEYFRRHITDDVRHCETWATILEKVTIDEQPELIKVANSTLDSLNLLLDGCVESYC
jgi:pyrroloquinoline-quinone synthase